MSYEEIAIIDNKEQHNFELWIEGRRSFIEYEQKEGVVFLLHTEVPKEQSGKGIAAALVEKTLEHIRQQGQKFVPRCSYVQAFLQRHPEWNSLKDHG